MSQIAFIDAGIADYASLRTSIPQDMDVYLLDAQLDGIAQMAEITSRICSRRAF